LIERLIATFDTSLSSRGSPTRILIQQPDERLAQLRGKSPWNPKQSKPATAWEAEIDRLMQTQAAATADKNARLTGTGVQQIVAEQQPFIYLINRDAMSTISPAVNRLCAIGP